VHGPGFATVRYGRHETSVRNDLAILQRDVPAGADALEIVPKQSYRDGRIDPS